VSFGLPFLKGNSMSISNLLGKQSSQYILNESHYKKYTPGGVEYTSHFYATAGPAPPVPALGILAGLTNVIGGDDAEGRFVRLRYTKIGFNVTIRFEAFQTLTANIGNPIKNMHTLAAAVITLTLDAVDQPLLDQILNDLKRTNPVSGVSAPVEILLPAICANLTVADQIDVLKISNAGLLTISRTSGVAIAEGNQLELGSVSFVCSNNTIL